MIQLNNDTIAVEIDTLGAQMQTITVNGEQRLWHGDPAVWSGRAPVLFPICGGLPDDTFTLDGKEYRIPRRLQHSQARKAGLALSGSDGIE